MKKMSIHRKKGATAIEYGLITALIAGILILILTITGVNINNIFGTIGNDITSSLKNSLSSGYSSNGLSSFTNFGIVDIKGFYYSSYINPTTQTAFTANCATPSGTTTSSPSSVPSQTATDSCLRSNPTQYYLQNNNGGQTVVPPILGPNTGFTLPGNGTVQFNTSGNGDNFVVGWNDSGPQYTSSNVVGAQKACSAIGGTFSYYLTYMLCSGGSTYITGSAGSQVAGSNP